MIRKLPNTIAVQRRILTELPFLIAMNTINITNEFICDALLLKHQ